MCFLCLPFSLAAASDLEPLKNISTSGTGEHITGSSVAERQHALLKYCSELTPRTKTPKETIDIFLAQVLLNQDLTSAYNQWEASAKLTFDQANQKLGGRQGDNNYKAVSPADGVGMEPFDKCALVYAWMICRNRTDFPKNIVRYTRQLVELCHHREWKGYDALNYRLMMDGSGFIAAEQWPDLVDADGLNATGIKAATKGRLLGYFDDIVHHNYHEYGATANAGVDMGCVKMLAEYAEDTEVRHRAELTLDWMLLNVACAWNQGYFVSPAGRAKYLGATVTSPDDLDTVGGIGWIYFGALRPVIPTAPFHSFWFACPGRYHLPEIFNAVANDRKTAFVHLGAFSKPPKREERMTIYHTPGYSLASEWNPIDGPRDSTAKENRRQMLKWISDKPFSTFSPMQDNVTRPYIAADMKAGKANAFGYGENPYTQVLQYKGTLVGLTDVDKVYPLYKLYVPFSTTGAILRRAEKDGWIFCHGGSVLFAFRTLKPSHWEPAYHAQAPGLPADVLVCGERINGWVLETSPVTAYAGGGLEQELSRFMAAIFDKSRVQDIFLEGIHPHFEYLSLNGHKLKITFCPLNEAYSGQHQIDGQPVDYANWPLLSNLWVSQPINGDQLEIHHDRQSLVYNFKNWTKQP